MTRLPSILIRLPFASAPDCRDESQIDSDLDDEFAFHLEMKTRDLIVQGGDPNAALGLARSRFGDLERIKSQCKRIALEERIMLQRINLVLMIVVLVIVVIVAVQAYVTQRHNTLALQDITAQLAKMREEATATRDLMQEHREPTERLHDGRRDHGMMHQRSGNDDGPQGDEATGGVGREREHDGF